MATAAVSSIKTINFAGVGPVELTVEERGNGQPFLLLHGGAGPQSVAGFARMLARGTVIGWLPPRTRALVVHPGRTN